MKMLSAADALVGSRHWRRQACRSSARRSARSFMLPVPDASMPAVEICSDKVGGRDDHLGQADIVVRQEHQPAAGRAIAGSTVDRRAAMSLASLMISLAWR